MASHNGSTEQKDRVEAVTAGERQGRLDEEPAPRDKNLRATRLTILFTSIGLLIYAFASLLLAVFMACPDPAATEPRIHLCFVTYLMWISGAGALGALCFLAVNSLAIQKDATFDISDPALVGIRIILGSVFGSIVSLPFCFHSFRAFTQNPVSVDLDFRQGFLMLAPFVLGFSTTIAMAVLGRMIDAVGTMFGIERGRIALVSAPNQHRGRTAARSGDQGISTTDDTHAR